MEDVPLDESIYPPSHQFPSKGEESEIQEEQALISFQTSSKKEESEEFEVIKKPVVSRHSSFEEMDDERD